MASDVSTAMNAIGQLSMAAGAGLVGYSIVGNMPPASYAGVPANAAMVGGLAMAGFGAALSVVSKGF